MRSGFVQESLSHYSRLGATANDCGLNLLTFQGIYQGHQSAGKLAQSSTKFNRMLDILAQ
jgi:hypothetical protein